MRILLKISFIFARFVIIYKVIGGKSMIDIHTHILPGVDDGSSSVKESLEMLKIAEENGTTDLILTPHCNIPGMFKNYKSDALLEHFNMLKDLANDEGISVNLYNGMEIFLTEESPLHYQTDRYISLNNSRYLLVEFDFDANPDFALDMLNHLANLDCTPIVAHPERYYFVLDNPSLVKDFKNIGCKLQLNRSSILGGFGKKIQKLSHLFLKNGFIDFVASDSHSPRTRTPRLNDVYYVLAENYGKDLAEKLVEINPRKVILDEDF
jgi:protein-tyrosine phosphatase